MTTTFRADGNHVSDSAADAFAGETSHSWYYLTGVDVASDRRGGALVAFGDSITDGFGSTPAADNAIRTSWRSGSSRPAHRGACSTPASTGTCC